MEWKRWLGTGAIALVAMVSDSSAGVPASQPGDARVYVGTYTEGKSKGVYLYHFNAKTGELIAGGLAAESQNPTFLAMSADGRHLFAANEISSFEGKPSGAVSAFNVESATGKLSLINQGSSAGVGPCYVSLDAEGRHVLVANYTSGSVAMLPIEAGGRLLKATDVDQHEGHGADAKRQAGPHAHSIAVDPTGRFALSADLGMDKIYVYHVDTGKHRLVPSYPASVNMLAGSGPRHFAIRHDGKCVYVANELNSKVSVFASDIAGGSWREVQNILTLPEGFAGTNYPADIHIHPLGKFVYVSNRGLDDIVVYAMDESKGLLTLVGHESTRGSWPRNFAIDPSGRWLIVANQKSDSLCVFRIDERSGRLTPVGEPVEAPTPACVLFAH